MSPAPIVPLLASALLALIGCAGATEPAAVRSVGATVGGPAAVAGARPCASWAMPTYALVNGAWRDGARSEARTLYIADGLLRERAAAPVRDTLDLRGLELTTGADGAARGRARDRDPATFVARRIADGSVALRVTHGCVAW